MMCDCGGSTEVADSRNRGKYVERRRVCKDCGQRFPTWEVRRRPPIIRNMKGISAEEKRQRRAADPERAKEAYAKARIRKAARIEARAKGEPIETIYQRWGVAA